MNAKSFAGKVGGIGAHGNYVSIDSADVAAITPAIGGLARVLAKGVGLGVGAAVGLAGAYALVRAMSGSAQKDELLRPRGVEAPVHIPITALATIASQGMSSYGVCLTDAVVIAINGVISIPTDCIESIRVSRKEGFFDPTIDISINTVDGGTYSFAGGYLYTTKLQFMTPVGMQVIDLMSSTISISGLTKVDVHQLRARLHKVAEEQHAILCKLMQVQEARRYFAFEVNTEDILVAGQPQRGAAGRVDSFVLRAWVAHVSWTRVEPTMSGLFHIMLLVFGLVTATVLYINYFPNPS